MNYGRWQVIEEQEIEGKIKCKCECGTVRYCSVKNLRRGLSKSCGCISREKTIERNTSHNMTKTILYRRWASMIRRCESNHYRYGGRGITVCEEWKTFEPFREWALKHGFSEELEIDRKDNNGRYEPSNCRWVTKTVNSRNKVSNRKIEINGETKTASEWAEAHNIPYKTFMSRLARGWEGKKLLHPVETKFSKLKKDFL